MGFDEEKLKLEAIKFFEKLYDENTWVNTNAAPQCLSSY